MAPLRSVLYVLFLALTVIPWATATVVLSVFVSRARLYRVCRAWLNLTVWGARWICGVRHRMHGVENLRQAEQAPAVVLLPKHQSTWETFAFPGLMPRPLSYVFKRELLRIPFFGWAIGSLEMIHIDRSRHAQAWSKVEEQGKRFMAKGHWVIMFPEGTRAPRGGQGHYKTGGTRLAVSAGAGAVVVPIAVTSARCWPRKTFVLRPGVIDVSVGPPLPVDGRSPDDLMRDVEAWIETEMRRLDPQAYPAATVPLDVQPRPAVR
ncbi:MAG: lysophospholipid acyltransferase family protein [Pseudomonadota bacterium]